MSASPDDGMDFAAKIAAGLTARLEPAAFTAGFVRFARFAAFFTKTLLRFRADFLTAAGFVSPSDIFWHCSDS